MFFLINRKVSENTGVLLKVFLTKQNNTENKDHILV